MFHHSWTTLFQISLENWTQFQNETSAKAGRCECGKMRTRITLNTDTFYIVHGKWKVKEGEKKEVERKYKILGN